MSLEPSRQQLFAQHRRVIEQLAHGLHPETGEPLSSSQVVHEASVIRALFSVLEALRSERSLNEGVTGQAERARAGRPWTRAEDEELRAEFAAHATFRAIAQNHDRTRGAIQARLVRLGLVQATYLSRKLGVTAK